MYSFESRVRYSELAENGRLSLDGIVNYLHLLRVGKAGSRDGDHLQQGADVGFKFLADRG